MGSKSQATIGSIHHDFCESDAQIPISDEEEFIIALEYREKTVSLQARHHSVQCTFSLVSMFWGAV